MSFRRLDLTSWIDLDTTIDLGFNFWFLTTNNQTFMLFIIYYKLISLEVRALLL